MGCRRRLAGIAAAARSWSFACLSLAFRVSVHAAARVVVCVRVVCVSLRVVACKVKKSTGARDGVPCLRENAGHDEQVEDESKKSGWSRTGAGRFPQTHGK